MKIHPKWENVLTPISISSVEAIMEQGLLLTAEERIPHFGVWKTNRILNIKNLYFIFSSHAFLEGCFQLDMDIMWFVNKLWFRILHSQTNLFFHKIIRIYEH